MWKLYIFLLNYYSKLLCLRLCRRIVRDLKDLINRVYKFSQRIFNILNIQRDSLSIIIQSITSKLNEKIKRVSCAYNFNQNQIGVFYGF